MDKMNEIHVHVQLTPTSKNLHFLRNGKKVLLFCGGYWQFRLRRFFNQVLNFFKGDLVVDHHKNTET